MPGSAAAACDKASAVRQLHRLGCAAQAARRARVGRAGAAGLPRQAANPAPALVLQRMHQRMSAPAAALPPPA